MRSILFALLLTFAAFAPVKAQAVPQQSGPKATLTPAVALGEVRGAQLVDDTKKAKIVNARHSKALNAANAELQALSRKLQAKLAGDELLLKGYRQQISEDAANAPAGYQYNSDSELFEFAVSPPQAPKPAEPAKQPEKKE